MIFQYVLWTRPCISGCLEDLTCQVLADNKI